MWKQYEGWVTSPQLLLCKKAEKLGKELTEVEGIKRDKNCKYLHWKTVDLVITHHERT